MSSFLLNKEWGRLTNLLPSSDDHIKDIYTYLEGQILSYLNENSTEFNSTEVDSTEFGKKK